MQYLTSICSLNEVEDIVSQCFPFFNNSWQLDRHSMSTNRVISFSIYLMPVLIMIQQIVECWKWKKLDERRDLMVPSLIRVMFSRYSNYSMIVYLDAFFLISAIWLILWHLWYSVLHKLGIISMIHTWNWYIIHSSILLAEESSFQVRLSEAQTRFSNTRDWHFCMSWITF